MKSVYFESSKEKFPCKCLYGLGAFLELGHTKMISENVRLYGSSFALSSYGPNGNSHEFWSS